MDRSIRSIDRSIDGWMDRSIHPSIHPSINQSMDRSIDGSIDRSWWIVCVNVWFNKVDLTLLWHWDFLCLLLINTYLTARTWPGKGLWLKSPKLKITPQKRLPQVSLWVTSHQIEKLSSPLCFLLHTQSVLCKIQTRNTSLAELLQECWSP